VALTPLVKVAGRRREWLANVSAYTVAGTVTSSLVGAALGAGGALVNAGRVGSLGVAAATLAISIVLFTRELGWPPVPVPQLRRQTRARWGSDLPGAVVAALWGGDVGLTFSTYLTFSGAWLLVAVAVLTASPAFGVALFAAYWSGRAASVWASPLLLPGAGAGAVLVQRVNRNQAVLRRAHIAALGLSVLATAWLLARAMP
jgi:hypothetical protein